MSTSRGYVARGGRPGLWTTAAAGRELWCHSAVFDPFEVPGYDVLAPLGRTGRTVKALASGDRSRVVLRRVHGGERTRQRLRQEAALWGSVDAAHVIPVRDVVIVEPDLTVVVSDHAPGGGLDALLARRDSLDDGEIVTLVVPLAEALATAHSRGLAHGRLSAGNVVFSEDGRPMLADVALSCSDDHEARADVDALVQLATSALGGRRAGPVYAALTTPVASAAALAATVRAAGPARAIALHKSSSVAESTPSVSPAPRRLRLSLVLAAVVGIALIVGIASGHRSHSNASRLSVPTSTPTPSLSIAPTADEMPTTVTTDAESTQQVWWRVVQRLERQRVRAYTAALAMDGRRPVGLQLRLQSVHLLWATGNRAAVRVSDGWTSYLVVDANDHVVGHRAARTQQASLLLRRSADGWRLERAVR